MKEGKHVRKKFKIIEVYSVLILIATLFMSIGYAQITNVTATISGEASATSQDGVFITNIEYVDNNNADTQNSTIDNYVASRFNSTIVLGNAADSYITYKISVYNSTDKEQIFIKTLKDDSQYSNENIEFSLNGLEEYTTTIAAKGKMDFTITFKYGSEADTQENTLTSMLNFRFEEKPIILLDKEGQTVELNNVYPGCEIEVCTFKVLNFENNVINGVPMTYSFETKIDKPLTAKIYDKSGNEITNSVTMDGDGKTETTHEYTLKVIWDDSNTEENIAYNSIDYANKTFSCAVTLKATPDSDKYLDYEIAKSFNANIKSAPLYFNAEVSQDTIEMTGDTATLELTVKNYNLENKDEFNAYDISYGVSIADDTQYTVSIENSESQTIVGGSAKDSQITVKLATTANTVLRSEEKITLEITTTSPYNKKSIELPVTIKRTFTLADLIEDGKAGNYLEETITVKDDAGNTITVPSGFKATDVTDSVSEGVVIQDEDENEFVWVPCTTDGTALNTYAQNFSYNNGTKASLQWYYLGDPGDSSIKYSWSDDGDGEYEVSLSNRKTSVNAYGGFYMGRYEAGWPDTFTNGSEYIRTKNVSNKIPVSKKGVAAWNYVSQANALIASSKMYDSTSSVTSSLVDSYAWDTVISWIESDTSYGEILKNSTLYGNYYDHIESSSIYSSLYAEHLFNGSARDIATNYYSGYVTLPNGTASKVVELATGTLEVARVKNIYDMAGNMYEWTTEKGERDSKTYNVRRGGCFNLNGSADPLSMRIGYYQNNTYDFDFGFRVVLYIK